MSVPSSSSHKTQLFSVLKASEQSDHALHTTLMSAAENVSDRLDLNRNLQNVIAAMPDDSALPQQEWTRLTAAWTEQPSSSPGQGQVPLFRVFSTATATTSFSTTLAFMTSTPWMETAEAREPIAALDASVERTAKIDSVRADFARLGLTSAPPGRRSPLALFNDAVAARRLPSTGEPMPTSVLISLRESIDSALAALLQRRPTQAPAAKAVDKVPAIGAQCARPHLPQHYVNNVGVNCGKLLKELSSAKQAALGEKRLNTTFDAAVLFFQSFLSSLDESTLRP